MSDNTQHCQQPGMSEFSTAAIFRPSMVPFSYLGNGNLYVLHIYNIFDQRRLDIIDQVDYRVHDRLHIYPLCWIFHFPGIDTR